MAEIRLVRTTSLVGLRPLGLHGQPAVDAYRQLVAVVEDRLGPAHAALFARPERREDGGIDWFTAEPGPIRPLAELDEASRRGVEAELDRRLGELAALARSFSESGSESAKRLGALLQHATQVPDPRCRLAVGSTPLLVLWGFAPEREVPGMARSVAPPGAAPIVKPVPVPVLASAAAAPWAIRDWWRWLLLALLLLLAALLALRACAPLPPRAADVPSDLAREIERADAEGRALEERLETLRREREEALAACVAPPGRDIGEIEPTSPPAPEGNAPVTPPAVVTETPPAPAPVAEAAPGPALPELPTLPEIAELPSPSPSSGSSPAEPAPSCVPPRLPSEAPEVALVVDASGSMEEPIAGAANRLEAAKGAIGDLLDGLPGDVDVGLVEFRDCERIRRDRFYSQSERGQLKAQVDRLTPGRGTPLARSVERAGSILSSQVPGVIVVVTDGEDSCGGDPCAAARAIRAKRPNVVINVIDIGSGGESPAACMAEITGGRVYKPGSAVEFDRVIAEAVGEPDIRECR